MSETNETTALTGEVLDQMPPAQLPVTITPGANPYLALIETMVSRGGDLSKLDQMLDLQMKWEANEARKAYNAAVAEFKKNPPDIIKDKENKQYGSKYATLANLVNNGSAALAPFGLTVEWKIDQGKPPLIEVTCILKHALGHSEQVSISGGPDDSGAKNKLQQIKSTITYLKGETFQCVTGITARDCPGDNDGNGAGKRPEEKPKPQYTGKPTDGVWEAQSEESQAWLLKIAKEARTRLANDVADAFDYLSTQNLDTDEKAALWTRFKSNERTALNKAGANKNKNPEPQE